MPLQLLPFLATLALRRPRGWQQVVGRRRRGAQLAAARAAAQAAAAGCCRCAHRRQPSRHGQSMLAAAGGANAGIERCCWCCWCRHLLLAEAAGVHQGSRLADTAVCLAHDVRVLAQRPANLSFNVADAGWVGTAAKAHTARGRGREGGGRAGRHAGRRGHQKHSTHSAYRLAAALHRGPHSHGRSRSHNHSRLQLTWPAAWQPPAGRSAAGPASGSSQQPR